MQEWLSRLNYATTRARQTRDTAEALLHSMPAPSSPEEVASLLAFRQEAAGLGEYARPSDDADHAVWQKTAERIVERFALPASLVYSAITWLAGVERLLDQASQMSLFAAVFVRPSWTGEPQPDAPLVSMGGPYATPQPAWLGCSHPDTGEQGCRLADGRVIAPVVKLEGRPRRPLSWYSAAHVTRTTTLWDAAFAQHAERKRQGEEYAQAEAERLARLREDREMSETERLRRRVEQLEAAAH